MQTVKMNDDGEMEDPCIGSITLNADEPFEGWCRLHRILPSSPTATGEIFIKCTFVKKGSHKLTQDDFEIIKACFVGSQFVSHPGAGARQGRVRQGDDGAEEGHGRQLRHEGDEEGGPACTRRCSRQTTKCPLHDDIAEIDHILDERRILQFNKHPFLVSLKFSFQTPHKIYFVLDYVCGGDLATYLNVRCSCLFRQLAVITFTLQRVGALRQSHAQLYAAMLVLALEFLHSHDVIYRDLKPENILIDMNGCAAICTLFCRPHTAARAGTSS